MKKYGTLGAHHRGTSRGSPDAKVRGAAADPLQGMKKLIMGFNLASVAGLIIGLLTVHPLLTRFPTFTVLLSVSAFFASATLIHFNLEVMSRVSDHVGILSGTLALGWVLSVPINGSLRWMAFLPCIFPSFLLLVELYQQVEELGYELASDVEKAIQTESRVADLSLASAHRSLDVPGQ